MASSSEGESSNQKYVQIIHLFRPVCVNWKGVGCEKLYSNQRGFVTNKQQIKQAHALWRSTCSTPVVLCFRHSIYNSMSQIEHLVYDMQRMIGYMPTRSAHDYENILTRYAALPNQVWRHHYIWWQRMCILSTSQVLWDNVLLPGCSIVILVQVEQRIVLLREALRLNITAHRYSFVSHHGASLQPCIS